jgi:pyruvate dehydrogenase E2 component (dihydrolipoamide acetyltransferase)
MAEIVKMPKLSDTMTEGVVSKWHKNVGDTVKNGDLLAEIETDKATMEFESFQDGVLLYRGIEEGQATPVDAVLAILGTAGEDFQPLLDEYNKGVAKPAEAEAPKAEAKTEATPAAETKAEEKPATVAEKKTTASAAPLSKEESASTDGRLKASPLAKALAEDKGINLNTVKGSGDGGRVVKRDIENYKGGFVSLANMEESYTEVPVSQMRKTIAKRLAESKFSAPHFYVTMDIEMDRCMDAREAINKIAGVKISFNDFVIKAAAAALKDNPKVNSSWLGDRIRYNNHIHIGMAVAVEDGLLVPVIRFADAKTLSQIATETKDLGGKAKDKKLQPADWEGNTFTISNLGMFGVEEFTAIINPPDSCILAIGGIKQVPVVKNGQIVPGNMMRVTLSCDHRSVDGALAAKFLVSLKNYLENPVLLLGMASI